MAACGQTPDFGPYHDSAGVAASAGQPLGSGDGADVSTDEALLRSWTDEGLLRSETDERLLRSIYNLGSPFGEAMIVADRSAWPLFIAGAPAAWVFAAASGDRGDSRFALSLSLAEGSAVVSALVLKKIFRRPRPYVELPSIVPRSRIHQAGRAKDPYSFPSGHAAMSFSMAAAVALESGRWYVVVPSLTWAASVSLSRVWLGVHYPSDVLAGAILGGGVALVSHFIAAELIESEVGPSGDFMAFSIVRVTL